MGLSSRGTCRGGPWDPMGRPMGPPVGPRSIFLVDFLGTPQHATASHGIPWIFPWNPAGSIGIPHGIPRDTVKYRGFPWGIPRGFRRVPMGYRIETTKRIPRTTVNTVGSRGASHGNLTGFTWNTLLSMRVAGLGFSSTNARKTSAVIGTRVRILWDFLAITLPARRETA